LSSVGGSSAAALPWFTERRHKLGTISRRRRLASPGRKKVAAAMVLFFPRRIRIRVAGT
jgi:hypothetical protein